MGCFGAKMLDKSANFIKLKMIAQKFSPAKSRGECSGRKNIRPQDSLPVAVTIQEAEDVDGLGGRVDFIKCKIVLNWNEPDSQRGKKWVIHK